MSFLHSKQHLLLHKMKLYILKWDILIPDLDKVIPCKIAWFMGGKERKDFSYDEITYLICEK